MTKTDWLTCNDPRPMLRYLGPKSSERRMRLFASACCRRHSSVVRGKKNRQILEANEQFADGQISRDEMDGLRRRWHTFDGPFPLQGTWQMALACATMANTARRRNRMERWAIETASHAVQASDRPERERVAQVALLHDIFANPFRPAPTLDPAWLRWHDATIPRLAQQMYDSRDFTGMPILADALEEAGCSNADILEHCRGLVPHVRGCWVVDFILSKDR